MKRTLRDVSPGYAPDSLVQHGAAKFGMIVRCMEGPVRPFVVRFALTEPVIVNPAIALDGILAAATFRLTHDPKAAHLHLPLAKHGAVYAASEVHYEAPVFERRRPFVSNAHWARFQPGDFVDRRGNAKLVLHARSITFQLAEVAVPRRLWEEMLTAIAGLRPVEHPP